MLLSRLEAASVDVTAGVVVVGPFALQLVIAEAACVTGGFIAAVTKITVCSAPAAALW